MKRFLLLIVLLLSLGAVSQGCAEHPAQELSEWTVLFYFCGSDLESDHGYASGNLEEISYCLTYDAFSSVRLDEGEMAVPEPEDVQVVIETGGSKRWHAEKVGMEVRTDRLQRWHFRPARVTLDDLAEKLTRVEGMNSWELQEEFDAQVHDQAAMTLVQELPLASMAAPETLADFIRWGAENYPAKKYALVLWDHGADARKGLMIDELFGGDLMRLDELKISLAEGGVHFETVLFDACLMASLETACAIEDYADWMVASEELVDGKGTAIYSWLQQLYFTPQWDGLRLGRWICRMTQEKYSEEDMNRAEDTLTWSVIDLRKIDRLAEALDSFFAVWSDIYAHHPDYMVEACAILNDAFEFGLGDANMVDLTTILYQPRAVIGLERETYMELLDALEEAVAYNVHGSDRASAGGLSFCFTPLSTPEELDDYARVCPSSHYLALLDAVIPAWEAPDWVYEKAERLPKITEIPSYQIRVKKTIHDGSPIFTVLSGYPCLWDAYVDVCWLNPASGNIVRLGRTSADFELDPAAQQITFSLEDFIFWPTLENVICAGELVSINDRGERLYNVPLMVGEERYMLRCGAENFDKPVTVYGFWEGYNPDSGVFCRNVIPLSRMAGQEFSLLYPIDGTEGKDIRYERSEPMTLYRALEVSEKLLDPGTYYLDFEVLDLFLRPLPLGRVEVQWDGERLSTKEEAWGGEMLLTLAP